jgi:hypothetical protein
MVKNGRPEPGFEPGTEDPQSHMLPGYTTRAIDERSGGNEIFTFPSIVAMFRSVVSHLKTKIFI